ncbi:LysR substrate-binding domain-containing protein, partial [Arthrospira platensis SPKY1]|nr:LysR substrate-binding domain-containing protein [Arthrospira platensis SPKY1]
KPTVMSLGHTQTYLVGAIGDKLTRKKEVKFRELEGLPLVSFCRPSSWRGELEGIAREHQFRLNVVLEADSIALQMAMVEQGLYCLLGGFATHEPQSQQKIQLAQVVDPCLPRSVVVELSRNGQLTSATKAILNLFKNFKKLKL